MFSGFGRDLADLLGRRINAVLSEYLSLLFKIRNKAVDKAGIILINLFSCLLKTS